MSSVKRVAVIGASGRMGSEVVRAVNAAGDLQLVSSLGRGSRLAQTLDSAAQAAVVFSPPDVAPDQVVWLIEHGIHAVVGTSGWDDAKLERVRGALADHPEVGVLVAPNFGISAVLLGVFARKAAQYFESVEIIELHHPDKADAPSGTAVHTAQLIAQARREAGLGPAPDATTRELDGARGAVVDGVHVHGVRLRGLNAHEEVLFGGVGEQLTIRQDSFDRVSFMPGVLIGLRTVASRPGLTVGLEHYLDLT